MGAVVRLSGRRRPAVVLALALTAWLGAPPRTAVAATPKPVAGEGAGTWDLIFEKGNRRCRLMLRADPAPPGFEIAMPAGCRRAFPLLAAATNWTSAAGYHVVLQNAAGQPVLDFAPDGGPSLSTIAAEGEVYTMTPADPEMQDKLRLAKSEPAPAAAVAAPEGPAPRDGVVVGGATAAIVGAKAVAELPNLPPATIADVAGNYAVLRQTRDTGCMVTLAAEARGKSELKARLAPACRDQGIVIFDPVGWQLVKGQLVLLAKKGHSTALSHVQAQTWSNTPAKGVALVLKRL